MNLTKLLRQNVYHFSKRYQTSQVQGSVEEYEVKHLEHFASDWWDPSGPMKALHSMNKLRIPLICNGLINSGKQKEVNLDLPNFLHGFEILDVGCGGGILSMPLSRLGGNVTGIDPANELIKVANEQAKILKVKNKPHFISMTLEEHSINNQNKYDVVIMSEVVEHLTRKHDFIISCCSVLKPGGSIFITTLNKTVLSWLLGIIGAEYILNLIPRGTHDWDKFVSPREIELVLKEGGCKTKLINGMMYMPLQNKWYWTRDKSINYALHAIKEENKPENQTDHKRGDRQDLSSNLLAPDVASMGMKVVGSKKGMDMIRQNLVTNSPSNSNQFSDNSSLDYYEENLHNDGSLQLSAAETGDYRNRFYENFRQLTQSQLEDPVNRVIPGVAGVDYPTLSKPPINFKKPCSSGVGYVADKKTGCQVFYICIGNGVGEPLLCPNGTLFSQDFLVCDWWYNVECN